MTTGKQLSAEKQLELLERKQEYLWQQLDSAVEIAENSRTVSYLLQELDVLKAKTTAIETKMFFEDLEEEYNEW